MRISDWSSDVCFSDLGDSVFQFDTTVAPILDVFGRFGLSRRTLATMRDVARASGATVWEAARLSWRAHHAGPRVGWRRDLTYLHEADRKSTRLNSSH